MEDCLGGGPYRLLRSNSKVVGKMSFVALAASLLFFATSAHASPTCLMADQASCVLKTDHEGLKVQVDERGQIVVVFGNSSEDFARAESYVNVQDDLDRLEKADDVTEQELSQIETELKTYDGAKYSIPGTQELKETLGFPKTSTLGAQDYVDLLRVHMQLVLSVSALTSAYLTDILGVSLLDTASPAVHPTESEIVSAPQAPRPGDEPGSEPAAIAEPAAPVEIVAPVPAATPATDQTQS